MRAFHFALVLAALLTPAAALAAEVRVLSPGFVYNAALQDLAAAYSKETGVKVIVSEGGMPTIVQDIKTGAPPADVAILPADLMNTLYLDGGIVAGSYTPLGRDEVGLAVKAGAPHPDISTVANLAAVLRAAQMVMINDPKGGTMQGAIIGQILARPEFAGVHVAPVAKGEGAGALARGEGDMALQLVPEILNKKGIELVAPLPQELGGHMDAVAAVSARSSDAKDAAAFIRYITRPAARAAWKAKGLMPF